jgi:hypothetical protein
MKSDGMPRVGSLCEAAFFVATLEQVPYYEVAPRAIDSVVGRPNTCFKQTFVSKVRTMLQNRLALTSRRLCPESG